ncbi:elongation factor EF-2 [Ignicoccus islandicus DSM 13165]|uniref:Elongation factor 2 n=1 Tax=Ignicoccus islandicus DSM 13165 TaxID=940295 RepID=A0A0U2U6J9_9CREN|nr:elongation factor EF-2 [Ignicoccus islandicus]ALU11780.1 elongation factor EF-2 [Ignicoccus islandicus DSM 13165]
MPKYKHVEDILKIMRNIEQVRNIGIIAHVDHGKTTTSDALLAHAGILSPKLAGEARALDYLDVEQQRGITVKAANVSLYHEYKGKPYVINLIDTPGHVDFSGKVTRSLRVLDGAILVVDAVEGVMTQTETVLRQALEEYVRPLLFINKVDRLIKELKLSPQEVQQRIVQIIKEVNERILTFAPDKDFAKKWLLDPAKGHVALGSAKDKWGITIPMAQEKGIKFSFFVDAYKTGNKEAIEELFRKAPLHETLLDMVVRWVPNPREAQQYRVPRLWKGDINSELGKAMVNADPEGPLVVFINDMRLDPHTKRLVATGRVWAGTATAGKEVWLVNAGKEGKILQVSIYMGPDREIVDYVTAGNIVAMMGLDDARAGETIVDINYKDQAAPFEQLHYVSEPVVTVAIEPKNPRDLPKLIEALRTLSIEDPNLKVTINQETGEYLLSGMGMLHIEIALTQLKEVYGLDVKVSPPIITYRETVRSAGPKVEGKSPNKHNKLYITVEPLEEVVIELIQKGEITEDQDPRDRAKILREKAGWDTETARRIWAIDENYNVFIDKTVGVQHLREVKDTILGGWRIAMKEGPLAKEPIRGVKVILWDAIIHEDPAHRGPAQLYPAVRNAVYASMLLDRPTLLEPLQKLDIRVPSDMIGSVTGVISKHRGKILDIIDMGGQARVIAVVPIAESFDLPMELRSVTAGRAFWGTEFYGWAPVPDQLLPELVAKIRQRKGLPPNPPKPEDFLGP